MTSAQGDWSVRANYWRGDRALGGHLKVSGGMLIFDPHGLERSLGGDTVFTCTLSDVRRLSRARRSFRVPRRRLIVTTRTGDEAFFLVPKLDDLIERLRAAIEARGGRPEIDLEPKAPIAVPEERPDNSGIMNAMHSGWGNLAGLVFWLVAFVSVLAGSRNGFALALLGLLIAFTAWRAWAGFRRRAAIRAQLDEPPPETS
jgi:hypothetical protein